ncbi:ADP-ribosylation factor-like protein 2 [Hanseniaspora osmophila]|uniref:ADP-ribosylation factor-like protein 2 n=1 Tax=Hanseniaspora osmophila TaxID=56408 RepID=A0A1E5RNK5_9ASCO|nr:ADP-ribosylation factor-like protein 2 [Hanseniaspora osmophila]
MISSTIVRQLETLAEERPENALVCNAEKSLSHIQEVQPTVGFSIKNITYANKENYTGVLNIWDIGGQKSLRPFWNNYYDSSVEWFVWCVDASDTSRLAESVSEFRKNIEQCVVYNNNNNSHDVEGQIDKPAETAPLQGMLTNRVLVLLNKVDLTYDDSDSVDHRAQPEMTRLDFWFRNFCIVNLVENCVILPVSGKTGYNIVNSRLPDVLFS